MIPTDTWRLCPFDNGNRRKVHLGFDENANGRRAQTVFIIANQKFAVLSNGGAK